MRSGIKRRWLKSMLPVIVLVFFICAATVVITCAVVCYGSVLDKLQSGNNDGTSSFFGLFTSQGDEVFETGARIFVEGFNDRDKMELMVIDGNGDPIVSSSGFEISEADDMPDYEKALVSKSGTAVCRYLSDSGESLMAYTFILKDAKGTTAGAVRYIVSMQRVNFRIITCAVISVCVAAAAVLIICLCSLRFVSTISAPVVSINATAQRVAQGNFEARINSTTHNDEIGELSKTINQMAEQLGQTERMKNEFISTISHEIRTPLTAIRGWGETINSMADTDDPVIRKGLQVIISETERLSDMVEDLLDFSRMQNGSLVMKPESIDVIAELDESCFIFKERAEKEKIELLYTSPEAPAMMKGDANRIRQVFINILDNALKYNHEGGKITVEVDMTADKVIIYIRDSGCGIPGKDLPRVKEKFFKANYKVHGSGIGLAVADEIVRKHNGELKIDSVVDLGTTVTVTLPLESEADRQSNEKSRTGLPG